MSTEDTALIEDVASTSSLATTSTTPFSSSSKRKQTQAIETPGLFSQKLREDEYDIIGKNIAAKLRKLTPEMTIYAEKVINEALFEAQLNSLTRYSHVTTPRAVTESSQGSTDKAKNKCK